MGGDCLRMRQRSAMTPEPQPSMYQPPLIRRSLKVIGNGARVLSTETTARVALIVLDRSRGEGAMGGGETRLNLARISRAQDEAEAVPASCFRARGVRSAHAAVRRRCPGRPSAV